eukprot:TRINITY_DN4823_c0_g1_i1.p1 TRINITY_DN4823_c0_g1~~TRINITY_DN4823_c0_g1_i1.p1  ORF type:complete len:543 (+),score=89.46 TRINITY_DN4823_c0_g1_i1:78-1631(+)
MTKSSYYTEHGEALRYDASWEGVAPSSERQFRDKFCGIFFFGCLLCMALVTGITSRNSDIEILSGDKYHDEVTKDWHTMYDHKYILLVGSLCTMALAFIWMEFLKRFTKCVVYTSLLAAVGAVVATGIELLAMAHNKSGSTKTAIQIAAVAVLVVAAILVIVIFLARKRINFTCAVIAQGCKGIQANPSIFLVVTPIMTILSAGMMVWWTATMFYIFSAKGDDVCGGLSVQNCNLNILCDWNSATDTCEGHNINENMRYLTIFMVFMFFWVTQFLSGLGHVSVAGCIASWYFARVKSEIPCGSALTHFNRAISYSFGSIAKGSALLAVFRFVNWCLSVAQRENKNCFVKVMLCLVQCLCRCIEAIVRFVTRFAYVYVAMHGKDFVDSCKAVDGLFNRGGGKMFMTDMLSHLVVYMGMCAAVGLVAFGSALYLDNHGGISASVMIVLIAFCCFTFWLVGCVVQVAADTVIVCYLEDSERNSASRDFRGDDTYFAIEDAVKTHGRAPIKKNEATNYGTR